MESFRDWMNNMNFWFAYFDVKLIEISDLPKINWSYFYETIAVICLTDIKLVKTMILCHNLQNKLFLTFKTKITKRE